MSQPPPGTGRLIAFEGVDGCGKSTQARLLAQALGVTVTSEPGGTAVGRSLRRVLLDPALPELSPRAEALLMAADRAEHVVQVLRPALERGQWVVTDRYSGSTLAYQGFGRGLDVAELECLVRWAAGGLQADLSVLVDVELALAELRMASRGDRRPARRDRPPRAGDAHVDDPRGPGGHSQHLDPPQHPQRLDQPQHLEHPQHLDRMDRLGDEFRAAVRQGFLTLADADPAHWVVVDGAAPIEQVAIAVRHAVTERLGDPPGGWRQ